jgi:hypothetical protein
VIAAGGVVLGGFRAWERRRERSGLTQLVNFELLRIPTLRSSLGMFVAQNAILLGVFFTVPLYLQVVQGYDAFKTGVQMLPVSIAMLVTAMKEFPNLSTRMEMAYRIGGRRWDVKFKGRTDVVAFPEDARLLEQLEALNLMQAQNRVLDLPATRIDARH